MFRVSLHHADHIKRFSITSVASGWEVREEEDQTVHRLEHYHDWHRVERTMKLFEREVMQLTEQGWIQASTNR